jgi:hypothetical protein
MRMMTSLPNRNFNRSNAVDFVDRHILIVTHIDYMQETKLTEIEIAAKSHRPTAGRCVSRIPTWKSPSAHHRKTQELTKIGKVDII